MKPDIDAIVLALPGVADPERRGPMAAYMRDQFQFLGVGTPARRAATKALYQGMTVSYTHLTLPTSDLV